MAMRIIINTISSSHFLLDFYAEIALRYLYKPTLQGIFGPSFDNNSHECLSSSIPSASDNNSNPGQFD
ncbi:hypothetical protein LguiA_006633 [Lonicera macranthoides]